MAHRRLPGTKAWRGTPLSMRRSWPEPTGSSMTARPGGHPDRAKICYRGTRDAYSYAEMIGLLVDEGRYFQPGQFPNVSRTGSVWHVGHYTQIIWPTSRRVGCATASNRSNDYLVCRYLPAGNVYGTMLR